MDTNVDQCSAVDCTAAQPCLTKSPKKKNIHYNFFSVSVLLLASVERFSVSRMRDFLLNKNITIKIIISLEGDVFKFVKQLFKGVFKNFATNIRS